MPNSLPLSQRLSGLRERLVSRTQPSESDVTLLWAAVALILTPSPDSILLIRRAERSGDPWAGHMALPGGRQEAEDESLLATAIRETREEVGIQLDPEQVLGILDDVIPRIPVLPPIAVRPFVFLVPTRPELTVNNEVAATTWVTLDHLLLPETHHPVQLNVAGQSRTVLAYELDSAMVWGMTERMLTKLLHHLSFS